MIRLLFWQKKKFILTNEYIIYTFENSCFIKIIIKVLQNVIVQILKFKLYI